MRRRSRYGWLELIEGILLILLGIYTLCNPGGMLRGITFAYGFLAVITGNSDIVFYAKSSSPSVCNAADSLLIHKDIAKEALVAIKNKLDEKDVTLVGDSKAREIIPDMEKATDADWATEFLDYMMSVKILE